MTAEEKAEELFYKYRHLKNFDSYINDKNAKQCALIAVDEVIEQLEGYGWYKPQKTYWDAVKQEIEKL
jgi:hypothetical protein